MFSTKQGILMCLMGQKNQISFQYFNEFIESSLCIFQDAE
jgi:hypothetical protein